MPTFDYFIRKDDGVFPPKAVLVESGTGQAFGSIEVQDGMSPEDVKAEADRLAIRHVIEKEKRAAEESVKAASATRVGALIDALAGKVESVSQDAVDAEKAVIAAREAAEEERRDEEARKASEQALERESPTAV